MNEQEVKWKLTGMLWKMMITPVLSEQMPIVSGRKTLKKVSMKCPVCGTLIDNDLLRGNVLEVEPEIVIDTIFHCLQCKTFFAKSIRIEPKTGFEQMKTYIGRRIKSLFSK